jgi:hypothetical protein
MNNDIKAGLLLLILGIGCVLTGLHFGHQLPGFVMLIPVGVACDVASGFLLAGGMRRK